MSEPIRIDIWSDIACPWCYIGKRHLEQALERTADDENAGPVDIVFHSYELSPDTPVDFRGDEVDFLVAHKGLPRERAAQMLEHVADAAAAAGLEYRFDLLRHANTVRAHELLHLARTEGVQLELEERLMRAYFTEGRDLGDLEVLLELGADVGIDRALAREALESNRYLDDVRADEAQARSIGVTGVPFFVFDRAYAFAGAQPVDTFVEVLRRLRSGTVETQPTH
ncbi:DsbA family oxidoreductase [Pseudoclavibacter chungangensis]|uniref:DsbA family oxidoreductase n=1 Tax=Pseudoclavibacter chungangensis TaxID=587635 RepID=A0A7J5BR21_9MICO|nr:DsbA family oxidoreductase [Pseudoclavibacter chungangensis]KAB1656758.1 DsbA family oxidoreductase [Pseudoclavibacter chungangensis]NYJ67779.1 putative DsbA family dithiol-disulfide isomerase [Pseudoclavibacter chungangensis]